MITKPIELQKGDRVVLLKAHAETDDPPKGTIGIVSDHHESFFEPLIPILWESWSEGWNVGPGDPLNGWAVMRKQLRKLS